MPTRLGSQGHVASVGTMDTNDAECGHSAAKRFD
jgi:hypothetical protein